MRQVRSGSHLRLIGNVWYYRRAVPPDLRDVFGVAEVKKSLNTSNRREAERLEKQHDIEFEDKLAGARRYRADGYPRDRAERIEQMAIEVLDAHVGEGVPLEKALLYVPDDDRAAVDQNINGAADTFDRNATNLELLFADLKEVVHATDDWDQVRPGIVDAVKTYCDSLHVEHSLDWALGRWKKAATRPAQTEKDGDDYIADFKACTHVRALSGVRRSHLLKWRDELQTQGTSKAATPALQKESRKLGAKTINHRLEIVSAIIRTGWLDAEIDLTPNISKVNLPEPANDRGSWKKEELLKALGELEPRSGQAWLYVLGLTTSTRIGETIAARKEWYKSLGFIEVPAPYTKMKKPHVMPIIEMLRGPLERHLETIDDEDFMFPDAPRPSNPKLKISHEISKWFSRFHTKHKIPRVIHELRDTWIEAARHNEVVKKEIYEIITGHSNKTGSDGYGGERPSVLMGANESICRDLLDDDLRAAILRLVE